MKNKKQSFYKYHGAGNDFIMIDNRKSSDFDKENQQLIEQLCSRRFGIGADGLILLQEHPELDLEMVYFNADGKEGSMCGNGGRCFVAFAHFLGLIMNQCRFLAVDGPHEAVINEAGNWVELKMIDVSNIHSKNGHYVMDTGSPHYITFVEELAKIDVFQAGRAVRYNAIYKANGINVNFVEPTTSGFDIATYERGVEAETLACGTGVTAAAIAYFLKNPSKASGLLQRGGIPIRAKGGNLKVRFEAQQGQFKNIWLCGPAEYVFEGAF